MTKVAYLDCVTGIAGDMCLGALVDSGVPLEYLIEQLKGLKIDHEYELSEEKVQRNGQQATKVHVKLLKEDDHEHHHHHHHTPARHLPEIERMIQDANLPSRVTQCSLDIFRRLAIAEGAVHGVSPEKVHFHEVGATDAIVDIVGTCLGLDYLDIETLYCSALPTGGGTVYAAHGRLPVPVPAVLKLWESRQVPIYSNKIEKELVTPTGAAIAVTLVKSFGQPPNMVLEKVGLGAGSQDLSLPNILRFWIGESVTKKNSNVDIVAVLETQIDDLSPQVFGYLFDVLLNAGALDVFTQSVMMKKSRPGILLTVICSVDKIEICEEIIFRETTTLGIRQMIQKRSILDREIKTVKTQYGEVRVKIASQGKGENKTIINLHPEYEDCATIAREFNQPLTTIQKIVLDAFYSNNRT
ncbi:MAG: nickel pincer cofactor biosynthesis protein LarC [Crocosphaera sp.]|nr:nickel pincer cofactor biosynthesis protein LarC [Crocosphaera sp.]